MKFATYTDKAGQHRWRAVAKNGKTVADSGEGYASKGNATKALQKFISDVCIAGPLANIGDEAAPAAKKVVAKKVVAKKVVAKRAK
jgi:uncharacterized protein YegP (UPF0339 family)